MDVIAFEYFYSALASVLTEPVDDIFDFFLRIV